MKYLKHISKYMNDRMSMDIRHSFMLESFLSNINNLTHCVEVGSCYGISTAAILTCCELSNASCDLVDINFQPVIKTMYELSSSKIIINLHETSSIKCLDKILHQNSIVLLDGDHTLQYVTKEINIIKNFLPRSIVLHDVTNDSSCCDGPRWAFDELRSLGYYGIIDCKHRQTERTERGLGILCKSIDDYEVAKFAVSLHD